ncbi:MAG: HIT family protein [Candidatus Micrarchaeota archaeon]|nr:HIT family protein [Candidatus Micrarchaeota archaeon]
MDCVFCKIANGLIKSSIVFEDSDTVAFLDISPLTKGHTLVVPKKHYENIHEIPYNELESLIRKVKLLSDSIKASLKADGINIFQNNGRAAGQVVFHIHFHVVPRYNGDHLDMANWKRISYSDENEKNSIASKIRNKVNEIII